MSADPTSTTEERTAPEPDDPGSENRLAAAVASLGDGGSGWSTGKVALLVIVVALMTAAVSVSLADRFGSPRSGSVDVGFIHDMVVHHEQAIQLGVLGVANASDDSVSHFALEAIIAQQYEIGYMDALLDEWGIGPADPDRDAMAWMDMPTTVENMPGMATPDQMDAFRDASGADADAAFLRLMTEHHRGGIHMARYARDHAQSPLVADLADRMVRNQTAEIAEYAATAERLGITL